MPCAGGNAWKVFLYCGPVPGGLKLGEFNFGATSCGNKGTGPALSRDNAKERAAQEKKRKREAEIAARKENMAPPVASITSGTASALAINNRIWSAVTLLKNCDDAEVKSEAMKVLRAGMLGQLSSPTPLANRDTANVNDEQVLGNEQAMAAVHPSGKAASNVSHGSDVIAADSE